MPSLSQSFPKRRSHQSQSALYPISGRPEYPNAQNVLQFLKQVGITETPLSVEHVESLLNVLVLDGEIERVIQSFLRRGLSFLSLLASFLRMAPLSGIPRLSRTIQSLNLSAIPKANGNTDLAKTAMVAGKARAQNVRIAIRNWMMPLLRHEKRRAASQNAKAAILTADQGGNGRNPSLVATTVTKTRRKAGRRNERSGPSQDQKSRKAESNLRTSLPPLRPAPILSPIDPPGTNGLEVLPSQGPSRKPRKPLNGHHPLHRSRNTVTRAWGRLMYTGRSDRNV